MPTPRRDRHALIIHTSDLHLGAGHADTRVLEATILTATNSRADVLLLAGDIFDHNDVPLSLLARVANLLADAPMQVVVLPGNHDCLTEGSVYHRGPIHEAENVHILGVTAPKSVLMPELDLEVWGLPHVGYGDYAPLGEPRPRLTRLQVAMAHAHFVRSGRDRRRRWLITEDEIAATGADYVALGHWDIPQCVGSCPVPAYYSGSPVSAGTVNRVLLNGAGDADVRLLPLRWPD